MTCALFMCLYKGALGIMIPFIGNGIDDLSSNPG